MATFKFLAKNYILVNFMYKYFGRIDRFGRLHLPLKLRRALKLDNAFVEIDVEKRKSEKREVLVLVPSLAGYSDAVESMGKMNLPLEKKNWKDIAEEIEAAMP